MSLRPILPILATAALLASAALADETLTSREPAPPPAAMAPDAPVTSGAVCTPDDGAAAQAVANRSAALAQLQQRLAQQLAEDGGEEAIVLNGRGYGYHLQQRPSPAAMVRQLELEAERQRGEQGQH